jgi:hypothetical protein
MRLARAALVVSAVCLAAPAAGQERKSSPLPDHLPVAAEACFGRTYDDAHLRKHPRQRVTSFHILRDFSPDTNAEFEHQSREDMLSADGADGIIGLAAYVRLRGRKGVYSNHFSCRRDDKGAMRCGIDCDGGSFSARPSGGSLLIQNEGFVVVGGCGGSEEDAMNPVFIDPGADDKVFRLDNQPLAQCTALRDAQKPVWAKLGPPLRERFSKDGALCLSRSYDAAHLARHPQQSVKRIAVLKSASGKPHEPPQYNLSFRVELKDGRKFEGRTNCWPDDYTYACTHDAELDTQRSFYLTRAGDAVMLRDRKGSLGALLKTKLGSDDRMFRLDPSASGACEF